MSNYSEEAVAILKIFEERAEEKFNLRAERHGKFIGNTKTSTIMERLLDEVCELIVAFYDPAEFDSVLKLMRGSLDYIDRKESFDSVETELYDVRNLTRIMYVCGVNNGDIVL